jgi:hypothetical protein
MLDEIVAAFGSFEGIKAIIDTRQGVRAALLTNPQFAGLLRDRVQDGPVQGLAVGQRLAEWIKDGMQGQAGSVVDWSKFLPDVSAFAYTVRLGNCAHLDLRLECKSETQAVTTRQLLKMAVTVGSTNFQNVVIEGSDQRVDVSLDAALARRQKDGGMPPTCTPL